MKIILINVLLFINLVYLNSQVIKSDTLDFSPFEYFGQENIGKSMPEFKHKIKGKKIECNKRFLNKITFINFWFEACQPCIAEFRALNDLYLKYKYNPDFSFVSYTWENSESVVRVRKKYNIKYPIITLPDTVIHKLNFQSGFPTNLILDRSGLIRFFFTGGVNKPDEASRLFKQHVYQKVESIL